MHVAGESNAPSGGGLLGQLLLAAVPVVLAAVVGVLQAQASLRGGRRQPAPGTLKLLSIRMRSDEADRVGPLIRHPAWFLALMVFGSIGCAFSLFFSIALENAHTYAPLRILNIVLYALLLSVSLPIVVLYGPRLLRHSAFPPGVAAAEVRVTGPADDLLHHLQRLLLSRGWLVAFDYEPSTGALLLAVRRIRFRVTLIVPETVYLVGNLSDEESSFAVISYSLAAYRTDFGVSASTIRRIERSFAVPAQRRH